MDGFTTSTWVKGQDANRATCWRNKFSGVFVYTDPERAGRGLADGPSPNAQQTGGNSAQTGGSDAAWEEYTDPKTKNKYWHNRVKNETTWKDPKTAGNNSPPPPPPPQKTENTFKKREQDQWFKIDDPKKGKVWYNEKTEKTQNDRPFCLRKYR